MTRATTHASHIFAWVLLCAGLSLGISAYLHFLDRTATEAVATFEEESRDVQRAIETRLSSYSSVLYGLRGLYVTTGRMDPASLSAYLDKLELPERYPAVVGIQYLPNPGGEAQGAGFAYQGPLAAVDQAASLRTAVLNPPALARAAEDEVALTIIAGNDQQAGRALLQLPIRGRHFPPGPGGERPLIGWLSMQVSMARVVGDVVPDQDLSRLRLAIHVEQDSLAQPQWAFAESDRIVDGARASAPGAPPSTEALVGIPLSRTSQSEFGGRTLGFHFSGSRLAFTAPTGQMLPGFMLVAGAFISLLLFSLLSFLSASSRRLEFSVAERTRDLEAVNRGLHEEIAERSRLEQEIFHLNVEERRRFGHDLHENIGQHLAAVGFLLQSLKKDIPVSWTEEQASLARLVASVGSAVEHTRMLALGISPVAVGEGGLVDALARLAASTSENFGVECRLRHDGSEVAGSVVMHHNLFRIVQQAITNAISHGYASRISIELSSPGKRLRLAIIDNGVGINNSPPANSLGMGLRIMRFRCSVLDLKLSLVSGAEGGTSVVIEQNGAND